MGTKTIMYDRVVPPGGEFRPRTRVRVRLVAADSGEGTGYNSSDRRTIIGVADELLASELFVVDLDAQASITAPAVTAYEITRVYPGWPAPPAETFTAPTEPTPSATTQSVTLPAANIAASTSGFASSGAIYLAGQLVTYTGTTPTAFTGCTGGSGLIPSGTAVRQAYWIASYLVSPPTGLPNLHVDNPSGAHSASAVATSAVAGLSGTNVQAMLASAQANITTEAATRAAADTIHAADLMRRQRVIDISANTYGGINGEDTGNDGPSIQNALNDWAANGGYLSGPSDAVCRTTQGLVLPSAATERVFVVNGNNLVIHGIGAIDILADTVPTSTSAASARTVRKFVLEDFKILGDGSGGAPATTGQRGLVLRGTSLAELGGLQVFYCDINFDLIFALNGKLTDCFAKYGNTYDYKIRSGMGRVVTDGVLNGTTTLMSATAAFTSYDVGKFVAAAGVPPNTTVVSRVDATTVIMSAAATVGTPGVPVTGVTLTVGSEIHDAVGPNSASNITSLDNCRSYARAGAVAQFYIYQSGEVSMTNCTTEGFAPVDAIVFDRGGNTTTLQFNIKNWHPENAPTNSHLKLRSGPCMVALEAVDWTQGLIMIDAVGFGGEVHLVRCPRFNGKFRHADAGGLTTGNAWVFTDSGSTGTNISDPALWDNAIVPQYRAIKRLSGGADGFGGTYPVLEGAVVGLVTPSLQQVFDRTVNALTGKIGALTHFALTSAVHPDLLKKGDLHLYRDEAAQDLRVQLKTSADADTGSSGRTLSIPYDGPVGYSIFTRRTVAPADADLLAGELAAWFDQTNASPAVVWKAKSADGTVRTGRVELTGGPGAERYVSLGNFGATPTINLASGTVQQGTFNTNAAFAAFTAPPVATGYAWSFTLIVRQDGTGGRTATWNANVKWPSDTAPTLTATAGRADVLTFFTVDGGTTWIGSLAAANIP